MADKNHMPSHMPFGSCSVADSTAHRANGTVPTQFAVLPLSFPSSCNKNFLTNVKIPKLKSCKVVIKIHKCCDFCYFFLYAM